MKNVTKKMVSALLILSLLLSCGSFTQAKAAIKLSKSTVNLKAGRKTTLKLKDAKGKTIKAGKIKWSSTNKKIARVSQKGVVTGVKAGTAKVTAKYKGKKYTCKIIVEANRPADNTPAGGACKYCNGTGQCNLCHGSGRFKASNGTYKTCTMCHGTGVCHYCNGTGRQKPDNASSTAAPSTDVPSATSPADGDDTSSEYSVKASDGTTITAERGKTAIHAYQSYLGKERSNVKIHLPNFESYTGGEFSVASEEEYQDEWSNGYIYEYRDGYTPVPCYKTTYVKNIGGEKNWTEKYIEMLTEFGFKVNQTSSGLTEEYFLRYKGTESITGNICCTYNTLAGICITHDMYIKVVGFGPGTYTVTFEYPVEVGFEMDSVKTITQDTSLGSTYYPASKHTFFAFGGNMTVGEFINIGVNKTKLKKGAVFHHSDLAKESEMEDGDCEMILKNTYRAKGQSGYTNLYPSSDQVEDAEIKVLAADSKNVAFYFKLKLSGSASHTFVFEGIASGIPPTVSSNPMTIPPSVTLHGVCPTCYGRKVCPVCRGKKRVSYPTYGQSGFSGWVNCAGCNGTGKCWKCGGSGK